MSTVKETSEVVRLPRLDRIGLGTRKETGKGTISLEPADYFVCPPELRKAFGNRPETLRIMFPTEDSRQWAAQFLRCYSASRELICRGDGETALAKVDSETGEIADNTSVHTRIKEITCNPGTCAFYRQDKCRRVLNLQFLIPDCPGLGVYELDTSSSLSILSINFSLGLLRGLYGRVSMIPLCFRLVKPEVPGEGIGETERYLKLTVCPFISDIGKHTRAPSGRLFLLPAPDSEAPDDFPVPVSHAVREHGKMPAADDAELLDLWIRVKSKIWDHEIQDSQIARWFEKNYHLEAGLMDFDPPRPPAKFTSEMLSAFYRSIERHANR